MIITIREPFGPAVELEDGTDDSSYNDGCCGIGGYPCDCGGDLCCCGLEWIECDGCPDCCPDWDEED
ncbi:MAG TPA: hypothetical protein VIY56_17335 [Vicinamibacterales bacterium]